MSAPRVSVVIPTLNEEGNIRSLIERLDRVFLLNRISYELIFIDDHSSDATREIIRKLAATHPVCCYLKKGLRGKAFSLLEGFQRAQGELIAIIDADLQYPPEAIPQMVRAIDEGAD